MSENIQTLLQEAHILFCKLDQLSTEIKEIELQLNQNKIFFPFSYIIHKEELSIIKPARDDHKHSILIQLLGYQTQVIWFLCWDLVEADTEKGTKYRLYLISEEHENLIYDTGEEQPSKHFKSSVLLKKPFIEHKLEIRICYGSYLNEFILALTEFLKKSQENLDQYLPF